MGSFYGAFYWDTFVGHSSGLWDIFCGFWNILIGHSFTTPLRDTLLAQLYPTFLWKVFVWFDFLGLLLQDTFLEYSGRTAMWGILLLGHSYGTLLWDTHIQHS